MTLSEKDLIELRKKCKENTATILPLLKEDVDALEADKFFCVKPLEAPTGKIFKLNIVKGRDDE